jgi:hypothetical protein
MKHVRYGDPIIQKVRVEQPFTIGGLPVRILSARDGKITIQHWEPLNENDRLQELQDAAEGSRGMAGCSENDYP